MERTLTVQVIERIKSIRSIADSALKGEPQAIYVMGRLLAAIAASPHSVDIPTPEPGIHLVHQGCGGLVQPFSSNPYQWQCYSCGRAWVIPEDELKAAKALKLIR